MSDITICRHLKTGLGAVLLFFILAANANAEFYQIKPLRIIPRADTGDILLQFTPAPGENAFTGKARGIIQGSDAGSNKLMAVLLTAMSLGSNASVQMDLPPSFDSPQIITAAGFVAP